MFGHHRRGGVTGWIVAAAILVCFALLQVAPAVTARASAQESAGSFTKRCAIGTNVASFPTCLLDEGWVNDCAVPSKCKFTGAGSLFLRPVPNGVVRLSVSSSTAGVGSSFSVHAGVSVPKCTPQLLAGNAACWNSISFSVRRYFLPDDTVAQQYLSVARFGKGCLGGTGCSVKVLLPMGPARPLTGHYLVVRAEVSVHSPVGKDELADDEIALSFGKQVKCGTPGADPCPLKVFVKVLQHIRSGLALDRDYMDGGPVNFTVPTFSKSGSAYSEAGEAGQICRSGCANMLVTVVNPKTGRPAAGAKVGITLDPIAHTSVGGNQFVCTQTDPARTRCGNDLAGLTTDANGQIHLIYWAPGETNTEHTTLLATATCETTTCHAEGHSTTKLTVRPYLVYQHDGELTAKEVSVLVALARDKGISAVLNREAAEPLVDAGFEHGFNWLLGEEIAEETMAKVPSILTKAIFVAIEATKLTREIQEQDKLIAGFLEAIDMPGTGLDEDPFEEKIPAGPNTTFEAEILHGLFVPGHVRTGGAVWSAAQHLDYQYSHAKITVFRPEAIKVDVYEVSHCEQSEERD